MNFIYFNPDQMRADFAACYGHPIAKTPNLDRLAEQGTRFDQCHVQHTVCTPSRCSFMTGWYPHVRGHRTLWHPLQRDEPNTLKYLKQSGYQVHWIGKNDLLSQDAFEDSVTHLHLPAGGADGDRDIFPPDDPRYFSFLYGPMREHSADWHRVQRAIAFLRAHQAGGRPFMLYLPITHPHCPFTCPQCTTLMRCRRCDRPNWRASRFSMRSSAGIAGSTNTTKPRCARSVPSTSA